MNEEFFLKKNPTGLPDRVLLGTTYMRAVAKSKAFSTLPAAALK
jgi:hypothetical protein